MSCPFSKDVLDKLQQFTALCRSNSDILNAPELAFFKEFIESFGGKIPAAMSSKAPPPQSEPNLQVDEDDVESDLELDTTGCIEPDVLDNNLPMGDAAKLEISDEDADKADEKRREAMSQMSEQNFDEAIALFSEAIESNPQSALLFAKRGQCFLKLDKPNACIKDCTRALELNCDSATAYKFRGRAHRLIGEWEKAAKDLRQASNIDLDEQTDEWLKEVTPNAKKIEQHQLKQERKLKQEKRAAPMQTPTSAPAPEGMPDLFKFMQDPEIVASFQDPEVKAAFQDISGNFMNYTKYKDNPKVAKLIGKLMTSMPQGGAPGMPNFANMPFGGNQQQPPKTADDDNLD